MEGVLTESNVRNQQGEFLALAPQGEHHADEAEAQESGKIENTAGEGELLHPACLERPDAREKPGA